MTTRVSFDMIEPFLASGSGARERPAGDKIAELPVSLGDYTGNVAVALAAALAASDRVSIMPGAVALGSDVALTGEISWRNHGTWSGAGIINSATDYSGFNYTADFRRVRFVEARGVAASPVTDWHAVGLFSKHSNFTGPAERQNAALAVQHYKYSTGTLTVAQGLFAEVIDRGGNALGRTDFLEPIRAHGVGIGAPAYGGIFVGQVGDGTGTPNAKYAIAVEGEIIRTAGANAVDPLAWTSANNLDVSFLATARFGVKGMAGFMVNPFNTVPFRVGFLVGNSFAGQGSSLGIVDFASFGTIEADVPYALYARGTSFAVVSGPNNIALLRALNAAGNAEHNLLAYANDNYLDVALEATGVRLNKQIVAPNMAVYADNAAAAAGGVPVNGFYRLSSGAVMMRVA